MAILHLTTGKWQFLQSNYLKWPFNKMQNNIKSLFTHISLAPFLLDIGKQCRPR